MLAIGAGCLEVAMAIAGEPFYVGIAIDLGDQTRGNAGYQPKTPRKSLIGSTSACGSLTV